MCWHRSLAESPVRGLTTQQLQFDPPLMEWQLQDKCFLCKNLTHKFPLVTVLYDSEFRDAC